jgi:uncharacterized protein YjbJ (UPF0337 family)
MATAYTSTYGDGFTDDTPDAGYSDDGGDVDDDLEATRAQIEQTRSEMSTTIDAIQEKLSPSNIAQQAKDTVKEATVGKAQEMVSDAGNTAKGFGSNFIETVKANPVPAAIAGLGLGWLFMSGRKNDSSDSYSYSNRQNSAYPSGYNPGPRGQSYGYSGTDYGSGSSDSSPLGARLNRTQGAVSNVAGQAQDKVSDVASSVGDTASQVADNVQDTAGQIATSAQYGAQRAQSAFQQSLQSNPLAVGVVALAVGAAVGLSIPETDKENELLGETRDNVVQQAQQTVSEKAQQVQTVAQEAVGAAKDKASDSAQQQGLTSS